jgi:hypothetical protein
LAHLGDDLARAQSRGAVRGLGRGDEEANEPLEEPVPATVGRRGGRRREGGDEASGAVGSRGPAGEVEQRRDGDAEGAEEAAAAPGGGADRRELPQLPLVHGEGGAAVVQHPRHLAREAGGISGAGAGAGDGRGGRHGCGEGRGDGVGVWALEEGRI